MDKGCKRGSKSPQRQVQGRIAKAQGAHFERLLDAAFRYYDELGDALIEKTPEPMKPVQSLGNGKFVAFYERKAQPDFKGTLRGGQSIVMEAKWTSTDRMNQSRVLPAQAKYMDKCQQMGAACYVIVGFEVGSIYRIPWIVWRDMQKEFGRKYILETDEHLQRYLVKWNQKGFACLLDKSAFKNEEANGHFHGKCEVCGAKVME